MAVYDLEEQDQIDELKAWWDRYGGAVTVGLVLAVLVIGGVQGWRWWNGKRAEDASVLYSAVSDASRAKDPAKAKDAIAQITDKYAGTGYAPRAALLYAKMLYDSGDRDGAKAQYTWAAEHAKEDEIQAIARFRLAQVQVDQKQYDAALATLDAKHPDAFDGVFADLRGDALAAAGRTADARTAYETALAKLDAKSQYRTYVQVKHDTLGGATAASAAATPAAAATPSAAATPQSASTPAATATPPAPEPSTQPAPGAATGDAARAPKGAGK
ncbi:MAG TPA: tetratricopeptide repeat protein [Casimicrobiaceae bacterium]|nr:tetratricopeptide repeat protein [Casimicrobiaceae bacterium]